MAWNLNNHMWLSLATALWVLLSLYWYAYQSQWAVIDHPGERSSHQHQALTGAGLLLFLPLSLVVLWQSPTSVAIYSMLALSLLGFVDDKFDLSFQIRLAVQAGLAAALLWSFGLLDTHLLTAFLLLALLWWINLFNFMDGINGMAVFHAWVILLFSGWYYTLSHELGFLIQTALLLLAVFAVFNVVLKKLFMGDSGSLPLAWLLAIVALYGMATGQLNMAQIATIHAVFIADATFTLIRRVWNRQQITQAHATHLYQRLVKSGFSHASVSAAYAIFTALLCGLVWFTADEAVLTHVLICGLTYLLLWVIFLLTLSVKRTE